MTSSAQKRQRELNIVRDTVESVWVAIILAFVLRAFMVEAFVIPTGSMAPRLMGEHYDLTCPACGYEYSYGWRLRPGQRPFKRRETRKPYSAACPSCTYVFGNSGGERYVDGGDRVLVMKYLYRFIEPRRFDVVVFRNPQSNANNYIKRLIGLPGETIEIVHGDVFVTARGQDQAEIPRKPDRAQNVMWQIICDNDYRADLAMLKKDMEIDKPRRWALPDEGDKTKNAPWENTDNGRTILFKGSDEWSHLTFKGVRRLPGSGPQRLTVDEVEIESAIEAFAPRYGYNDAPLGSVSEEADLCSDLKLSFVVRPGGLPAAAECILDGMWYSFKAVFDADGSVTVMRKPREMQERPWKLSADEQGDWSQWASAKTAPMVAGAGREVTLACVDYGVTVWVDGERVIDKSYNLTDKNGLDVTLEVLKKRLDAAMGTPLPRPGARIGAKGGPLELTHLKLMRDVFYTESRLSLPPGAKDFLTDYANAMEPQVTIQNPGWGGTDNPITLKKNDQDSDLDEFFVLGDNSPASLDSRGWIGAAPSLRLRDSDGEPQYQLGTVPRYNMIGKAMFVYWPSGFRLPLLPGLPIVPDVGRMRLIR